jgi:hypothetical protein
MANNHHTIYCHVIIKLERKWKNSKIIHCQHHNVQYMDKNKKKKKNGNISYFNKTISIAFLSIPRYWNIFAYSLSCYAWLWVQYDIMINKLMSTLKGSWLDVMHVKYVCINL